MKVFTEEFVAAVRAELNKLEPGYNITRDQVCVKIGIPVIYASAVSILFQDGSLEEFEIVRAKGIRRKKR